MVGEHPQIAAWLRRSGPPAAAIPTTSIGWTELADRACIEGLAGLVLGIAAGHRITLPAHFAERLRESSLAVAADNIHALKELESVVAALNRAKIPVMLLKGAALNLTVYDRPDLRPMSDVDLLIHPENTRAALQVLTDIGCRRGADLLRDDFFPKYHYEVELFTGSSRPTRIDLHARPFRPLRVSRIMPDDGLWRDARKIRVGRALAMIPCPERMLLHLAGHAAFHGSTRMLWLYDIRNFVDHAGDTLDWSRLIRCAKRWHLSLPLLHAMDSASAMLGQVCPAAAHEELRSHNVSWRDRMTLAHAPRDASSPVAHFLINLFCVPGVRFKLGYARAVLFPTARHLAQSYPLRHRGWVVAAYATRSLRALSRAVAAPVHAVANLLGRSAASQ